MKLTARFKSWLVANGGVKATATDDEFKKSAADLLTSGILDMEIYGELTKTKEDSEAELFQENMKSLGEILVSLKADLAKDDDSDNEETPPSKKAKGKKPPAFIEDDEEEEPEDDEEEEKEEATDKKKKSVEGSKSMSRKPSNLEKMFMHASGQQLYLDDSEEKPCEIRVKEAAETYSNTKSTLTYGPATAKGRPHPMAGRPVVDYSEPGKGRVMETQSELDQAVCGAYGKFLVGFAMKKSRNLAFQALSQHDKELMFHAMTKMKWGGSSDGSDHADIKGELLTPHQQKALIDDATSGGIEAAPIVFDDAVIQTPLLNGELLPRVNTVPLDRGRRVEGIATGTVTGGWGGVDDEPIDLFDTTAYVTPFDTTIFRWEGAIRIGLDFLSDTPIDFGAHISAQYGERLLKDLDDVIATGNGTTQPEGIMTKSGTGSVSFGGATTIGAYESLRFGVAKAEHKAAMGSAIFCGTETSYQRAMAIPVSATDARRLHGSQQTIGGVTGYDGYHWMDRPYAINGSLSNSQIFYCIMSRYRMYRRRGMTMRTSTEGDTLIRRNEMLMVATCRYGGQLERGAVAAVTSDAPA